MMNRREWFVSSAVLGASTTALAQSTTAVNKRVVISSANGLAACRKAREMVDSGADTLDAVISGVNIIELDPNDTSVGYGGLPNEDGVPELDASVMHGPTRRCGAVGAIRGIKTPSKIAKLVMEHTTHEMIVGEGALRFAKAYGYHEEDLLTEKSRLAWLVWKQSLRNPNAFNNWVSMDQNLRAENTAFERVKAMFPNVDAETLAWAWDKALHPTYGTINCEMSGVTTTSGLAWKIPGRVGDSPIIGAGLYVDQDVGGAGSTGVGEENIRVCGGHTVVENMRHGMHPRDAVLDVLKRVSRNYNDDKTRLAKLDIRFYALRKDGVHAAGALWNDSKHPATYAVNNGGESRQEPCVALYQR
jgi:N4-(beta-N-acetylglucosaminyl)-L-asparaginase